MDGIYEGKIQHNIFWMLKTTPTNSDSFVWKSEDQESMSLETIPEPWILLGEIRASRYPPNSTPIP